MKIPNHFLEHFPDVPQPEIADWWDSLSEERRLQITSLCDERTDECMFTTLDGDDDHAPIVEGGQFLPGYDEGGEDDEWSSDHYEYLMNHPELVIAWDPIGRTFHIGCVSHRDALSCWRQRSVPQEFTCPFGRASCLMSPFLGRSLRAGSAGVPARPMEQIRVDGSPDR